MNHISLTHLPSSEDWRQLKHWQNPQPARPAPRPPRTLKCPVCKALAYDLWKISGLTYFKCSHCGHKSRNL